MYTWAWATNIPWGGQRTSLGVLASHINRANNQVNYQPGELATPTNQAAREKQPTERIWKGFRAETYGNDPKKLDPGGSTLPPKSKQPVFKRN